MNAFAVTNTDLFAQLNAESMAPRKKNNKKNKKKNNNKKVGGKKVKDVAHYQKEIAKAKKENTSKLYKAQRELQSYKAKLEKQEKMEKTKKNLRIKSEKNKIKKMDEELQDRKEAAHLEKEAKGKAALETLNKMYNMGGCMA